MQELVSFRFRAKVESVALFAISVDVDALKDVDQLSLHDFVDLLPRYNQFLLFQKTVLVSVLQVRFLREFFTGAHKTKEVFSHQHLPEKRTSYSDLLGICKQPRFVCLFVLTDIPNLLLSSFDKHRVFLLGPCGSLVGKHSLEEVVCVNPREHLVP